MSTVPITKKLRKSSQPETGSLDMDVHNDNKRKAMVQRTKSGKLKNNLKNKRNNGAKDKENKKKIIAKSEKSKQQRNKTIDLTQKQEPTVELGKFFTDLTNVRQKNMIESDRLENYSIGFDVPKKVSNILSRNFTVTSKTVIDSEVETEDEIDDDESTSQSQLMKPPSFFFIRDGPRPMALTMPTKKSVPAMVPAEPELNLNENDEDEIEVEEANEATIILVPVPSVDENGEEVFHTPWPTRHNSLSEILFRSKMFQLVGVSKDYSHCLVKCKRCPSDKQPFFIRYGHNSNLTRHSKTHHSEEHKQLLDEFNTKQRAQEYISNSKSVTYDTIRDEVLRFLLKENLPLHKIESQHLKRLILKCTGNEVHKNGGNGKLSKMDLLKNKKSLFSRRSAARRVKVIYQAHLRVVKRELKKVQFLSATCDIWSCKHRSYIAVNVTYINPKTFKSKSFLIAMERFEGSHTNDAVANKLKNIFKRFGIFGKVVGVTTDNGSEFVAAFIHYGDNYHSYEEYLLVRDEIAANDTHVEVERLRKDAEIHIISSESDDNGYEYDSDAFMNSVPDESLPPIIVETIDSLSKYSSDGLANIFDQSTASASENSNSNDDHRFRLLPTEIDFQQFTVGEEDSNTLLPIRIKCAAHSLNLVGKTDAVKALANEAYARIYCQAISKLNLLWKYCGSRKKSEAIQSYVGKVLVRPHNIRWNALYDNIQKIIEIDPAKLDALFFHLKIEIISDAERIFLQEFLNILQPIARGLTALEGNRYFAYYLITLFNIRAELKSLSGIKFKYCKPLLSAVSTGFITRFKQVLDMNNQNSVPLYLAMISHPTFKVNHIYELRMSTSASEYLEKCLGMLLKAIELIVKSEEREKPTANTDTGNAGGEPEFDVTKLLDMACSKSDIYLHEIKSYLREPLTQDLHSLDKFPNIKKVFLKFNCLMTSEADCERIFSYAATTLSPKRRQMSDEHFSQMLTLYVNDFDLDTITDSNNSDIEEENSN